MKKVSFNLIKKLRKKTGMGILKCKQALISSKGNIESAIEYLRKLNQKMKFQKFINSSLQGIILIKKDKTKHSGVILEVNSTTDFVSKNYNFLVFCKKIAKTILKKKINSLDILNTYFEDKKIELMSKFEEYINIRRFSILKGKALCSYLHGQKIGVLISVNSAKNKKLVKKIAMHIASSNPQYLNKECIPKNILKKEKKIQISFLNREKKSDFIKKKILEGRMKKFVDSITLVNQPFIFNPQKTIKKILSENCIIVKQFIRFELGEEIKNFFNT